MQLPPSLIVAASCLALTACASVTEPAPAATAVQTHSLFDGQRGRAVPILVYGATTRPRPLALISHGYGGRASDYTFIAEHLVRRGFVVASIQHELSGDAPLPST